MAFHDVRLPVDIEKGTQGGLGFYTTIKPSPSGNEQRNQHWEDERGEWDISYGIRKVQHIGVVKDFFLARRGMAHSFRFKDWSDYKATATPIATGDGVIDNVGFAGHRAGTATYQLTKYYADTVNPFYRQIFKLVAGTLIVYVDGVATAVTTTSSGAIIFANANIPLVGEDITATFEFDIPVRFGVDRLPQMIVRPEVWSVPSIKIVGVRPPDY